MDPLSAVSGITGTVAVGAKVLVALHGFAKGVKSAPEELKLLARELEHLCNVMDNFRKKTRGQIVSQGIEDISGAILDIFIQLNQLIIEHTVSEKDGFLKKGWKQVKWHYIEKDIADLRAHLNSNKENLLVALGLGNELQNGHSNMQLERVQEILKEVIERLQDHDMQTVATCESYALQRWQEVLSTIAPSSRPTTPNDQISVARSESGMLSEAGFSERSIPMSAYQFNDMETRGKGVLISDGTQAKAYTVKARKQKAGAPNAGSSKPPTKATGPALLARIPEPEEGDEVLDVKDDSKPGMTIDSQTFIKTPSKTGGPKPRGALRRARHRLKNFPKKRRSKVDLMPVPTEKGQVTPDEIHNTPGFSIEKFLQDRKYSRGLQKPLRKTHAIWPPVHSGEWFAVTPNEDGPRFLECVDDYAMSRDDTYILKADQRVRVITYLESGWFLGQVHPDGLVLQFPSAHFRRTTSPTNEELKRLEVQQIEALVGSDGNGKRLDDKLGIGGAISSGIPGLEAYTAMQSAGLNTIVVS
ncbi:hypothetical protein B9Z19DRAFT_1041110 [Tuber borchii]|uniref:Azaphilone pigments biosynthesis cluster protein L N-terminal domain-containing protein n=1 Tax=Tuber borchii TaxID=42251 RepID=A0A2T7A3U2_TUBBO|nr:hypothetical protein B9Z19DRAFT_1041110 [Tuber borchii]